MALINCPECGKEISENAISCPNCGCDPNYRKKQEKKAKTKLIIIISASVGAFVLLLITALIIYFAVSIRCPRCGKRYLDETNKTAIANCGICGECNMEEVDEMLGNFYKAIEFYDSLDN